MKKTVLAVFATLIIAVPSLGQEGKTPYTGQQKRSIKALSSSEISAYLNGMGMGLAKAAELNNHPGPKHLLELKKELQLTNEQIRLTQGVYDSMYETATMLGKKIVSAEGQLDELFATGGADEEKVEKLVMEIALLQGQLRYAHLRAHLETIKFLSVNQIQKYAELRGYSGK